MHVQPLLSHLEVSLLLPELSELYFLIPHGVRHRQQLFEVILVLRAEVLISRVLHELAVEALDQVWVLVGNGLLLGSLLVGANRVNYL